MAKINTTNYQPVTSWNGTQDLLIVEQPDGTKVATPEQVKQYVEAGDFEATGEIKDGHGNVLSGVVDEIGDLTQTGLIGDSVAEQLAELITQKQDNLKIASGKLASTAGTITIPYPTGFSKNISYIVGWNVLLNGSKYSGYSMGHSGTMLSIALNDSNISIYNNDTSFYGSWIYIILAKM